MRDQLVDNIYFLEEAESEDEDRAEEESELLLSTEPDMLLVASS